MRIYAVTFVKENVPNKFQTKCFKSLTEAKKFRRSLLDDDNDQLQLYSLNVPNTSGGFIALVDLFSGNPHDYRFTKELESYIESSD